MDRIALADARTVEVVEVSVDLLKQRPAAVKPQRRHLSGQREGGYVERLVRRIACHEPGIVASAQEAGVLTGPGEIAVVPDVLGQRHGRGELALAGTKGPDHGPQAGPVIGG